MKKSLLSALLVCSLTLAAVPSNVAFADTIDEKIEAQDQKINSLQGQQADVSNQISSLEAEIAAVAEKVSDLENKQAKLNEDTMKLQDKIATLKVRIAKREEAIKKQARDVQVNGQSTNFIDAVVESDSLSDAIGRVQAMTTIVKANNDLVAQQKRDKQAVETKVKENEEKVNALAANQKELETQKNAIANKQAELNVLKANLAAEEATAKSDKDKLNKQKAQAEAEAARIRKEQEAKAAAAAKEAARQEKLAAQAQQETTTPANNESGSTAGSTETNKPAQDNQTGNTGNNNNNNSNDNDTNNDNNDSGNNNWGGSGNGIDHSGSGNMYAQGQCTWYVKQVAPWVGTYWGNGAQWGGSAAADGYRVDGTPAAGAVVVFAGGQSVGSWNADPVYGHVAYVESYNAANNTITISQGGMGFSSPTGPNIETLSASGLTYIHR
ncbi:glucan-binding protein [Enterococcus montenegrensis]|uniref:CHAP domain-containing protein n=1 Tax=Enterococcus montenegrensis TaxID=3031993 RepID=UPI00249DE84A|nr:CHAP domain-containing protein [Enterococcus montenegrensis]WHA08559.1 glucan-binding protein [Enterococcus montenegrensis]